MGREDARGGYFAHPTIAGRGVMLEFRSTWAREAQDEGQALLFTAMTSSRQYVVCLRNEGYEESLELRKIYEVLDDPEAAADGLLRVVDEDEDYLYSATWFRAIDDVEVAISELARS